MAKKATKKPERAKAEAAAPETEEPIVLVGTWEEIQEHAGELEGKTLRVAVIPEHGRKIRLDDLPTLPDSISAAGAFKGKLCQLNFGPSDLSSKTGEAFTDVVAEKHRKGHLRRSVMQDRSLRW